MFRILIVSIICSFISSSLFSQSDVQWGPTYKKEGGKFAAFYPAGMDENNYYLVMRPTKSNNMLTFDYKHKLVTQSPLKLKVGKDNKFAISRILETKSGRHALILVRNRDKKQLELHASKFNDGKFEKVRKIHAVQFEKNQSFGLGVLELRENYFDKEKSQDIIISEDKSKVAYTRFEGVGKDAYLTVAVFDQDLNKIWKKKKKLPYSFRKLSIENMILSNGGDVFLSAELYSHRNSATLPGYKVFRLGQENFKEWAVQLEQDELIADAGLFVSDSNNQISLGGTYSTPNDKVRIVLGRENINRINGVFFASIDLQSDNITHNTHPFDKEFLEGLLSKNAIKKGKGLNSSYKIDNLITFDDGSFTFIVEEYFIQASTIGGANNTSTTYTYHSNDIIIPRFSKNGDLLKIEKIEKDFVSKSPLSTSYAFAKINSKIYLIYNDRKKRHEKKQIKREKDGAGGTFTDMTIFGADGNIEEQKTIFTSRDDGFETIFIPEFTMFNDKLILVSGISGKKYQFGTLKL